MRPGHRTMKRLLSAFSSVVVLAMLSPITQAQVAANAPKDRMVSGPTTTMERAIAPYIATAKATYPQARSRFLAGLPPGQGFFVVTRLRAPLQHDEQVFVAVQSVLDGVVQGRLASEVRIAGYHAGQPLSVAETDIVDWLITKPDGSEEGNVVGKFLDTYTPPR